LPDRTTLVKTRKLWRNHGIFEKLMKHVVNQCIAAGLVQSDVHAGVDGIQVRANASIHSMKEIALAPVESIEDYLARMARQDERSMVSPMISMRTASRPHRLREKSNGWKTKRHMKIFMAKPSRIRPIAA
jgi:hypothetical protein